MSFLIDYSYALIASIFWILSAPILNHAIRKIRIRHGRDGIYHILIGLIVALCTGTVAVGFATFLQGYSLAFKPTWTLTAAGIFTFPLATGLYYFGSYAMGGKTEVASIFAKVKPLFSIGLAVLFLGEALNKGSLVAVFLIVCGLFIFGVGLGQKLLRINGLTLGLGSALSWALGEYFVKLGFVGDVNIQMTFQTLLNATVLSLLLMLIFRPGRHLHDKGSLALYWPFIVHGIFSFAIAYSLYFISIANIGVIKSVIIVAFWPFIALVVTTLWDRRRGEGSVPSVMIWTASILFALASVAQVILD